MSAAQRLAAIVIGVIVVIGIAVVALNLADGGVAADPSPQASVSPAASPTTSDAPTDEPSPADEDDVLAALAEIEEQVIAIRGLPAADIGAPELLTRDELQDALLALVRGELSARGAAEDNASLRALGLLEPDQDVAELQLQLLGDAGPRLLRRRREADGGRDRRGPRRPGEVHVRPRVHPRAAGRRIRDRLAGPRGGGRGRSALWPAPRCSRATRPSRCWHGRSPTSSRRS